MLDVNAIRLQFPILGEHVHGKPLVYLDNAATTQKPLSVIERIDTFYKKTNANIHRGAHHLANISTEYFENTRELTRAFLNARETAEIIFTSGTTDSINLVAQTWGRQNIGKGDEILLSMLEHHSNIVPWQMLAEEKGAVIKVIPIHDNGTWQVESLDTLINERTKIVAVNHVSNALGTVNPIEMLIAKAHAAGAKVLIDGAQSVTHMPIDVQAMDCDFYCFSAHKLYGPTGVGVLWGRKALLDAMPPFMGGGSMIKTVTIDSSTYADVPARFEAGTPMIGEAIALGVAVTYLMDIGMANIAAYEHQLSAYLIERLDEVPEVTWYGPPVGADRAAMAAFSMTGVHPHDIAQILDSEGVAVRAGHHCTQPLHVALDVPSSVRASCYLYNNTHDIDRLVHGLSKVKQLFG
jgi:cysteine desulfurase/selenocysteine lyase